MIALTVSSSRLNARPKTSLPKSRSSEAMQPASPWIRAMPSPISTTVPTSADSACPSNSLIWALMMSVISEAVDGIVFFYYSLTTRQLCAQRVQLRTNAGIDQVITELDLGAADERLVDRERGLERVTGALLEPCDERPLRRGIERDRRGDGRLHDARAAVDEVTERARDVRQERDAVALLEEQEERADRLRVAFRGRRDGGEPLLHRHARAPQ